jgi:hypothetical protein
MVMEEILPDEVTTGWCPASGEHFPEHREGEIVVSEDFYRWGFRLPAHPFLCKLLSYYGIALVHLNLNSILHLFIFINLCEAYLGIDPHFNLFQYFSTSNRLRVPQLWEGRISCCRMVWHPHINPSH